MVNKKNETLLAKINERIVKKFSTKTTTFDDLIKVGTKFKYTYEDYEDLGYEVYGGVTEKWYLLIEKDNRYAIIETDKDYNQLKGTVEFYLDEDTIADNVAWFVDDMDWWND